MGTPFEKDEDRDAVVRYLEAEGGLQLRVGQAPRALVRGSYEGDNISLHLGRLHSSGTYLRIKLKIGDNELVDAFLDMLYPYGMERSSEPVAKYGGLMRQTLKDTTSMCWTWMGFGYAVNTREYADVSEHIMPRSVGYGWHSEDCNKNTRAPWCWCSQGPTCGKKVWMLKLSVFDNAAGQEVDQEKRTMRLTYVLFNKDDKTGQADAKICVEIDNEFRGWVLSVNRDDAGLGDYNTDLLKLSAETFVRSKRAEARHTHHPEQESYLKQVFRSNENVSGLPHVLEEQEEEAAVTRCLLQLLTSCEGFNFCLVVQVLYDQMYENAESLVFIEQLHALVNRGEGQIQILIGELRPLPKDNTPYRDWINYPRILVLLVRLLHSMIWATTWAKYEAAMRKWPREVFEMVTTWTPEGGCKVCGNLPASALEHNHRRVGSFPPIVLAVSMEDERFNLGSALAKWLRETRRGLAVCRNTPRCR